MTDPFQLADRMVDELVVARPSLATLLGIPGQEDRWDDLSPDGSDRFADLVRSQERQLVAHLQHTDRWQRHAARVAVDYLREMLSAHERNEHLRLLRHTAGDFDEIRDMFDKMETGTEQGWEHVITRMRTIAQPLSGSQASLEKGRQQGLAVARRQVESVIEQARHAAGPESKWLLLLAKARVQQASIADRLAEAIDVARAAAAEYATYLEEQYWPSAPEHDGVGRERYVAEADRFLGLAIDPMEIYQFGWDEVHRLDDAMREAAALIDAEASVTEVIDRLESDPAFAAPSQLAFAEFIQGLQDLALSQLDGTHFEVPASIRQVTVNLVPPGAALGAYYLPPSEDFRRPGGIWYSLGTRQQIPLWPEVSTGYHEGFPGHHLQVGTVMAQAHRLSRLHRLLIWYSGYGEGWALYTERLMDELGYFEEPQYLLGMLASQQLRAVRVVVDIGSHLGYRIPDHSPVAPGEAWTFEIGVEMLRVLAGQPKDVAESEMKRYLGWPGQAISYKVGEREILDLRNKSAQSRGASFHLRDFHRELLGYGEVRLDYLRELMTPLPKFGA